MRALLVAMMLVFFAATSFAADEGYLSGRVATKLKRGVVNVVTAPLEIPHNLKSHWDEGGTNAIKKTAYLFGGLVKGVTYTVGRIGSGLWDTLTCNLDIPSNNEPLMKPDYVWEDKRD